jgi:hypothetical protein
MPPFTLVGSIRPGDAEQAGQEKIIFPDPYAQLELLESSPQVRGLEYNLENSTTFRWSFALQRELGRQWVVAADYTGSRGVHLFMQSQANLNRWEGWPVNPEGPKFWPAIEGTNRINPAWGEIRMQSSQGENIYHGLGLSVKSGSYYGLLAQFSYTLSKNIDLTSGSTSDRMTFYWGDLKRHARGLSQFHQKHNLVSNFSYAVPLGENLTGVAAALASGWNLAGIISIASGNPRTLDHDNFVEQVARIGEDDQLAPNLIPGGNNNPIEGTTAGCSFGGRVAAVAGTKLGTPDLWYDPCQFALAPLGYFGNVGRGHLIMPGRATVDFSVHKNFSVSEEGNVQFRAEFFNFLNRSNFGTPRLSPWDSRGRADSRAGQITSTRGPRRIQLGLKYTF